MAAAGVFTFRGVALLSRRVRACGVLTSRSGIFGVSVDLSGVLEFWPRGVFSETMGESRGVSNRLTHEK